MYVLLSRVGIYFYNFNKAGWVKRINTPGKIGNGLRLRMIKIKNN